MKNAIAEPRVVVVGAGVAGLACATLLADRGYRVTVVEARRSAGGRTRSFFHADTGDEIDNGQHILMGCYESTLKWLDLLGTRHLVRPPTSPPRFIEKTGISHEFRLSSLPAPLHAVVALLRFKALTFRERWAAIRVAMSLSKSTDRMTVGEWLGGLGQSERSVRCLWRPLCVAVMNEEPSTASARLFADALRLMLFEREEYSTLLIPSVGLSRLFVEPAIAKIVSRNGNILQAVAVKKIISEGVCIKAVEMADGSSLTADSFIFAIPPWHMTRIEGFNDTRILRVSAIVSCFVWLDGIKSEEFLPNEMNACVDGRIHWIFRKNERLLQFTTSAANDLASLPMDDVQRVLMDEFLALFPVCRGKIRQVQVIKERQATMMSGDASHRPGPATRWSNGFLAGDCVDTGLPSTIESAVRSAYEAVDRTVKGLATMLQRREDD